MGIVPEKVRLHAAAVTIQLCYAGSPVLIRAGLSSGMSRYVLPVYRTATAFLLLFPFACLLERGNWTNFNFKIACEIFLLSSLGMFINQALYTTGLYYTTSTTAAAMQNLLPAVTFIFAVLLRLERVYLKRRDGKAKVLGTIFSVSGAMLMTMYNGPPIGHLTPFLKQQHTLVTKKQTPRNWQLGSLLLVGHCIALAAFLVLQKPFLNKFPARVTFTALADLFGGCQLAIYALLREKDSSNWKPVWGPGLLTVIYLAVAVSGIAFTLKAWCIQKAGPVFVAVYQPIQLIAADLLSILFLGDVLYTGSFLGGLMTLSGLYMVLWGKDEELRWAKTEQHASSRQPLLGGTKRDPENGTETVGNVA